MLTVVLMRALKLTSSSFTLKHSSALFPSGGHSAVFLCIFFIPPQP